MLSDFSGINLGRPGLGDKMLDSALDHGMPPTTISPKRAVPEWRLSSYSIASVHSPQKEDDTITSLKKGNIWLLTLLNQIPVVRLTITNFRKSRVLESKASIASTAYSEKFSDERMIRAKHSLLERQSLENMVLIAELEEDVSKSCDSAIRQLPVGRGMREYTEGVGETCSDVARHGDTCNTACASSFSDDNQWEFTHQWRPFLLQDSYGHQQCISQACASRTSIYETIEEEFTTSLSPTSSLQSLPGPATNNIQLPDSATKTIGHTPMFVADPETASVDSVSLWDDERGITVLRKYYALHDKVEDTVTESQRVWLDTPFSVFAVQSFDPPSHPSGMRVLLEHSMQNYGPLPSDLRPRHMRSRVNSQPLPYPRTFKTSFTSSPATEQVRAAIVAAVTESAPNDNMRTHGQPKALQQISVNPNIMSPAVENTKAGELMKDAAMSPGKLERVFGLPPHPHVGSVAQRTALGWVKRSTGRNWLENKENASIGNISLASVPGHMLQGLIMMPSETLRLNRPRPRGRPTPASGRPIRI
ncbi:hypothetical protein BD769DRAFT_1391209 [Suillus cothurnatus]|nr:hypothetical protein BD769DRAFT_1391209 [Suillus cothurnatus]